MLVTREQLVAISKENLFGKPQLEKFLKRMLDNNPDLDVVTVPGFSEDVMFELNQCLDAHDLPNPKFFWKPENC
jgi:hypothetical protein